MMNAMLVSFGDGLMMGRIDWPIDGLGLAVFLLVAFALLLMGLLRESRPDPVVRTKPARLTASLPGPLHQQAA